MYRILALKGSVKTPLRLAHEIGMFLELKTIWSRLPEETYSDSPNAQPSLTHWPKSPQEIHEHEHGWNNRRRRVGILFSKQKNIWNFLVLIGPGDDTMGLSVFEIDIGNEFPNAHLPCGNKAKCTERPLRLKNMIKYIDVGLKRDGPGFVESLGRDVVWGLAEFLKELMREIIRVYLIASTR